MIRSVRKKLAALAAMGLLASFVVVPPATADHSGDLTVQVGAPLFMNPGAGGAPGDGMRFYTPTLKVHKGDSVTFDFQGFHTATMLEANTDVSKWVSENVEGFGKPWSFVQTDPDEGADGRKFSTRVLFPSAFGCGSGDNPCSYNGTEVLNSGAFDPTQPEAESYAFTATIDANPGDTIWVVCLVHAHHMRFRIDVVTPAETATTQQQVDDFRDAKVAQDAEDANALHNKLLKRRSFHRTANGTKVWDAYAGFDAHNFSLLDMYPSKIVAKKGQKVQWHFSQLTNEDHTATFPRSKALEIANNSFVPVCDVDGDAGEAPDEEPNFEDPSLCPGGPQQIEIDVDPRFMPESGDGRLTSHSDLESSGVRGSTHTEIGDAPWTVEFTKPSGKKAYKYICLIHPFMRGKVKVTR